MWNNQFPSVIKVNRRTESSKDVCSESSSTKHEETFEFKRPYPPPLGKTYSRLRSLVDRPEKKSSPRIYTRPSPGLHFLETYRQRQKAKLRKFQSFPSPSSNVALLSPPPLSSLSESSLWSTSTTATVEEASATSTVTSNSMPEFPPLRRSKAMSTPSRSFPIPTMSGIHKTGGVKKFLETASSSNQDEDYELEEGLYETSLSEGLEMEICYDYSSAEPSEEDFKATSEKEFPIPTLITGRLGYPVFQPRSPPEVHNHNLDVEDRNNNDGTHDEEPEVQWSREQLDILMSAKDSFRFQQRRTVDLLFKELSAVETGKPCSKIDIRAWLKKVNVGLNFPACHVSLKLLTCDQTEDAPMRRDSKVKFSEEIKVKEIEKIGKVRPVDKSKD